MNIPRGEVRLALQGIFEVVPNNIQIRTFPNSKANQTRKNIVISINANSNTIKLVNSEMTGLRGLVRYALLPAFKR